MHGIHIHIHSIVVEYRFHQDFKNHFHIVKNLLSWSKMDREHFCKTFVFYLNSNGIQMHLFQKKIEKKKKRKQKIEKGPRESFQPRPGRGPRPSNSPSQTVTLILSSLSSAWAPPAGATSSSSLEQASITGA
jgi:hypothetical protein